MRFKTYLFPSANVFKIIKLEDRVPHHSICYALADLFIDIHKQTLLKELGLSNQRFINESEPIITLIYNILLPRHAKVEDLSY